MGHTGNFEQDAELLIENTARYFAYNGDAKIVSILANSSISAKQVDYDQWDGGTFVYSIYLQIPHYIYLEIQNELDEISDKINSHIDKYMHMYEKTWLSKTIISPQLTRKDDWQHNANLWISGDGVNNQGRVRSTILQAKMRMVYYLDRIQKYFCTVLLSQKE